MAQRPHLFRRRTSPSAESAEPPGLGSRVYLVQRAGAVVVALFLLLFGLGFARGQQFVSTRGPTVLGLASNGLLSTLSVIVAVSSSSRPSGAPAPRRRRCWSWARCSCSRP